MSLLISSRRYRKLLFAAAALAAGGYASYRIYNSSAFAHRRKRLLQTVRALSLCCEAVVQSAESISILSSDLKSFLLSDDDSVPQSLKQAFKIGQSEEFQGSVTLLSAALMRGLLRGINANNCAHACGSNPLVEPPAHVANEDVVCREIREVCLTTASHEQLMNANGEDKISSSNRSDCHGWEINTQPCRTWEGDVVPDQSVWGKPSEDLVDKLFAKLFSKPGAAFASAVTSTLARNLVLAYFDECTSRRDAAPMSSAGTYAKVINVINTAPCRMLIADCMQTFISTAVTVYTDKTKDVNFYNDIVAGITNPSHRDSMKDMLMSVCNGAVETLVKTSYGVMTADNERGNGFTCVDKNQWDIQESSPVSSVTGQLLGTTDVCIEDGCGTTSEGLATNVQSEKASAFMKRVERNNSEGVQRFIDGVSKALAIPSNRKLIVDVAGTMTSEAVRSFVDVVVHTASNHISSKMQGSWDRVKSYVIDEQGLQLQEHSRDVAMKAFILACVCLAVCLHMLTSFQMQQKM